MSKILTTKVIILFALLCLLFPAVNAQQTDFDSLYAQADVVLSGHVMSVDDNPTTYDLGTELYILFFGFIRDYKGLDLFFEATKLYGSSCSTRILY